MCRRPINIGQEMKQTKELRYIFKGKDGICYISLDAHKVILSEAQAEFIKIIKQIEYDVQIGGTTFASEMIEELKQKLKELKK